MVPAFPASGRTTRGGIHYVFGVPLAETQVAHDPHCPVTDSHVADVDRRAHGRRLGDAATSTTSATAAAAIAARLVRCMEAGARAVFCDAETDHDIEEIARAALAVRHSHGVAILPVDPGPFSATLVRLMQEPQRLSPLVFGIVGSVMETSRQQMDFVEAGGYAFIVRYSGRPRPGCSRRSTQAPLAVKAMLLRTDGAALDADGKLHLYDTLADLFERVVEAVSVAGRLRAVGRRNRGAAAGRVWRPQPAHTRRGHAAGRPEQDCRWSACAAGSW